VTGAGFGGSVLVLVDRELVSAVTDAAAEEFARRRWATPTAEVVAPSGGAHSMPFGSTS
jgi:galactokinase